MNYLVEGSGQKYGSKFVLRVQLITGKNERHLWGKSYDREIQQTTDIIGLQGEIARLIAGELKATITPEENQLIDRTPTTSLTAYNFFKRGREVHWRYHFDREKNNKLLENAKNYYLKALEYGFNICPGIYRVGLGILGQALLENFVYGTISGSGALKEILFHNPIRITKVPDCVLIWFKRKLSLSLLPEVLYKRDLRVSQFCKGRVVFFGLFCCIESGYKYFVVFPFLNNLNRQI